MSSRFRSESRLQEGFTLIEVMISMTLLAFISLAIYQATTSSFKLREKLLGGGDFRNAIRLGVGIIDRDFAVLFSPILMSAPRESLPSGAPDGDLGRGAFRESTELESGELSRATQFWGAAVELSGLRPSRFQGNATSMSFISASHLRIYKDAPETELAAITYALEPDPMSGAIEGTQLLMRTADPAIYSDRLGDRESKTARKYPLIRGITKLEFRYWNSLKREWERNWDTESADFRNVYPGQLQIVLEVKGAKDMTFEGQWILKAEIPLSGLPETF